MPVAPKLGLHALRRASVWSKRSPCGVRLVLWHAAPRQWCSSGAGAQSEAHVQKLDGFRAHCVLSPGPFC